MRLLVALVIILGINSISTAWQVSNPLKMWFDTKPNVPPNNDDCTGCAQNKVTDENHDQNLNESRVEYVKQQILRKLRLSKAPEVSMPLSTLPKPLINGNVLELGSGTPLEPENPAESFYGKTDQAIVLSNEGVIDSLKCPSPTNQTKGSAACFTFHLPNDMQFVNVTSAQFWFYKEYDANDGFNQTFELYDLDHWDRLGSFHKETPFSLIETNVGKGWVQVDVAFTVQKWIDRHLPDHAIQISCKSCSIDRNTIYPLVSTKQTLKPFLVIHTAPLPQRNRAKRNTNCRPGMTDCCRDHLYINFSDIGWHWIYGPHGYNAYFCRGTCSNPNSVTRGHGSTVVKWWYKNSTYKNQMTCCSPTQLGPLQLIYTSNNESVLMKTLPNMVVEACGCM